MATPQARQPPPPASRDDFEIAIICALPEERDTVEDLMTRDFKEEGCRYNKVPGDENRYTVGEIGGKPVVLVAPRKAGTTNTRDLARGLRISFPNILYAFVVGIAGGAPFLHGKHGWKESDIHLGDVIVSTQLIEHDFGRELENGFRRRTDIESVLPRAPAEVANFVNQFVRGRSRAFQRVLRKTNVDLAYCDTFETSKSGYHEHPGPGKDDVYGLGYRHKHRDPKKCAKCSQCTEWYHEVCEEALTASCQELGCKPHHSNEMRDTKIHFGRYASGNAVMKSGHRRDLLIQEDSVIGFEMAGAGAWEVFGTIVVKGVVGYADSHQYKDWRGYPAARAALCAAAMIEEIDLPDRRRASGSETSVCNSSDAYSDGVFFAIPEKCDMRLMEKSCASGAVTKETARRLETV
jgi:nucleoside phosphorylase